MPRYDCERCGRPIPATEVEAGEARGPEGTLLCDEHRPGQSGRELTLELFSGAEEPAATCTSCDLPVSKRQLKSGRAKIRGGRVTCAHCRVAAKALVAAKSVRRLEARGTSLGEPRRPSTPPPPARPPAPPSRSTGPLVAIAIVVAGLGGVGISAAMRPKPTPDARPHVDRLEKQLKVLETALQDAHEDAVARRRDVDAEVKSLRSVFYDVRGKLEVGSNRTEAERDELRRSIARLEAEIGRLAKRVATRTPTEPAAHVGNGGRTPKPATASRNPRVADLLKALAGPSGADERFKAAAELGRLSDPDAIPGLASALAKDRDYLVRRACARALGELRAWHAVPRLIAALEDDEGSVAQAANAALEATTRRDFGVGKSIPRKERRALAHAAGRWWERNKGSPPAGVSLRPLGP